jgi:hypothetical protein
MERRAFFAVGLRAAAGLAAAGAGLRGGSAGAAAAVDAEVEVMLATPANLDARARSNGTIEVTWEPVAEALAYVLQRRAADDDRWSGIATLYAVAGMAVARGPYVDREVVAGVRYRYRVRALSPIARSDWSNTNASIALATTDAAS